MKLACRFAGLPFCAIRFKARWRPAGGVHRMEGIIKLLLAGADVTLMTSVLLIKGPDILRTLLVELVQWLEEHEYASVEQLKGSMSRGNCPDAGALERANYMATLISYSTQPRTRYSE